MTRNRPAPSGYRPAPDATNASPIVEPGSLFEVTTDAYGGHRFSEPPPVADASPEPVKVGHQRMATTVGGESWLKLAESWIDGRVDQRLTVDADRMQAAVGTPPTAGLSAVAIRRAKLAGKIEVVGFLTSERSAARGHAIREWGPRG